MNKIKQMKLLSGEEILCDLVDVTYTDEEGECMVIRSAYVLTATEDLQNGVRYYTFRPFMMHIYDPEKALLLQSGAVICLTTPHPIVADQYIEHIEQIRKEIGVRDQIVNTLDDLLDYLDSDDNEKNNKNVIDFKPRLH